MRRYSSCDVRKVDARERAVRMYDGSDEAAALDTSAPADDGGDCARGRLVVAGVGAEAAADDDCRVGAGALDFAIAVAAAADAAAEVAAAVAAAVAAEAAAAAAAVAATAAAAAAASSSA